MPLLHIVHIVFVRIILYHKILTPTFRSFALCAFFELSVLLNTHSASGMLTVVDLNHAAQVAFFFVVAVDTYERTLTVDGEETTLIVMDTWENDKQVAFFCVSVSPMVMSQTAPMLSK